mgnify:CR=1 FL=1
MDQKMRLFKDWVRESGSIVFFGGAGVSTESGIPDFRSTNGLYRQQYDYPPEEILSHTFFMKRPEEFFQFYRAKMLCLTAKPNAAHRKLAQWEREGKLKAVVTQNIDGLHQAAGSREVLELHGSVHRNYCMDCRRFYDARFILASQGVPRCVCGGVVKPDVVLYEEIVGYESAAPHGLPQVMDGQDIVRRVDYREVRRIRLCPAEARYGCQIPKGVWHSVDVIDPCVVFEGRDGAYAEDGSNM